MTLSNSPNANVSPLFTPAQTRSQVVSFPVHGAEQKSQSFAGPEKHQEQQEGEQTFAAHKSDGFSSMDASTQAAQQDVATQQTELLLALDQARREGHEAGFNQALQQQSLAESELLLIAERFASSVEVLKVSGQALWAHAQQEVLTLALELAQRLLSSELQQRPEAVIEITQSLLREIHDASNITVRLHPDDLAIVENQGGVMNLDLDSLVEIALLADNSLERGGCIVEAQDRQLDGRINTRLRAMAEALQKSMGTTHAD